MTSESPAGSDDPREIVEELEQKVAEDTGHRDAGNDEAGPEDAGRDDATGAQGDVASEVPGSPEPSD